MNKLMVVLAVLGLGSIGMAQAANSADADILKRISPVGQVCIEGKPCAAAEAATAATSSAAAPAAAGPRSGEQVVQQVCSGCHGAGVMGAPKIGNKADWGPRIGQGLDTLLKHALSGYKQMPPKGTCSTCSDDEIKGAIKFMTDKSR